MTETELLRHIEQVLKEKLNLAEVYAQGENAHFGVIAVSDDFAQLSKVKQQQMIYAPLMDYFSNGMVHALSIKTFTTEQWRRERALNLG